MSTLVRISAEQVAVTAGVYSAAVNDDDLTEPNSK